jgi:hypothetical protein
LKYESRTLPRLASTAALDNELLAKAAVMPEMKNRMSNPTQANMESYDEIDIP